MGLPCYEERLYTRLVAHPSGFRRWHVLHELAERSRRREQEAAEDAQKLERLAALVGSEKEQLLDGMDPEAGTVPDSANQRRPRALGGRDSRFVRYDLVQRELREVEALRRRVVDERDAFALRPRAASSAEAPPGDEVRVDSANVAAELQLLHSTFAVLGEISSGTQHPSAGDLESVAADSSDASEY